MATKPSATKVVKKKVIVHSNDRENNEPEVFVGINGKTFLIKTGEEVELTNSVISVLKSAIEVKHESILDAKRQPTGEIKEVKRPRYIIEAV